MLLGRERELAQIRGLLEGVGSRAAAVGVLEGPAGIGKTVLLTEAARAAGEGFCVLRGAGTALEREYAFGVVRQLFSPVVARGDSAELLQGAAGLASAPLGFAAVGAGGTRGWGDPGSAAMHGLFWLVANLAERDPVLIAVDDAHWADAMSLRFLLYLARRLEDVAAVLLVASRPAGEQADGGPLAQIGGLPGAIVLRPAPLPEPDVACMIANRGIQGVAPEFVGACHRATGGNPFLLGELLAAFTEGGVRGTAADVGRVEAVAPESIARWVLSRLVGLGDDARRLASACAVLGSASALSDAAALAELEPDAAATAADALIAANILTAGRPYEFVHPLVRAAIYDGLSPARRAEAHRRAARLTADRGAPLARVAAHLLSSDPGRDQWAAGVLRAAAQEATATGAPASAASFLERAVQEAPPRALRAELLVELAEAQLKAGLPGAAQHMREALDLQDEPRGRAELCLALGRGLFSMGDAAAAREVFRRGLGELGDDEDDLSLELRAWYVTLSPQDAQARADAGAQLSALVHGVAPGQTRTERFLLAHLAYRSAASGELRCDAVAGLALRALADGALLQESGADLVPFTGACNSLIIAGEQDAAIAELDRAIDLSRRRGSPVGFGWFSVSRGYAYLRKGNVLEAIADLEGAEADKHEYTLGIQVLNTLLARCLMERGEVARAAEVLAVPGEIGQWVAQPGYIGYLVMLGTVTAAQGKTREALDMLLGCEQRVKEMNAQNPAATGLWRSDAALLAAQLGERDLAGQLIADELRLTRAFGAAFAIGAALRAAGVIEGGDSGLDSLAQSVVVLDGSGYELELARSLTEQGAALRRMGHTRDAVQALRRGLDLASRCGALVLAERAREELIVAGARPRRERIRGVDSLTASELRVARMAETGMTNRQIAEALFVTIRTVTTHLGHVYQKLEVSGREQLGAAIAADLTP